MINDLRPGDQLPGQPPGPFGSSDVMTIRELLWSPSRYLAKTFSQCLRDSSWAPTHDPSLGWTQAGEHHFLPF